MARRKKNYLAATFCFNLCLLLIIFNNRILSLSSCSSGNYVAIDNGEYFTMDWDDKEQRVKITPNFLPNPIIKLDLFFLNFNDTPIKVPLALN